ncbi:hypothetical protein [Neoroseomonas lacus]|uniref:Uncharacterized protein n=1 Tax=Neoroseomonas lacus TaxID=287609 RepID=A0A917NMV8_9PROT|nr:hypothetical protein [Neoroseomonas lacus]GGJ12091.1 hypothetical protein GCM10011320_19090 [Neoroseomonas lacus]
MTFDLPAEWRGFALALPAAIAVAGASRLLRRPRWGGVAAGLGLVVGFVAVLGVITGSPRHLVERLPALVLLGLLAGLLAGLPRPVLRIAGVAAGLLLGAWWMTGASLHPPDLLRAAPQGLAIAAAMALVLRADPAFPGQAIGWAALAAGVTAAGAFGPYLAFALAGAGAVLGAGVLGAMTGMASRLPLALGMVGVAAVPLLARAAPADIAAAAAPALALLAGPALAGPVARWLGPRLAAWVAPVLAAAPAVGVALLLRH